MAFFRSIRQNKNNKIRITATRAREDARRTTVQVPSNSEMKASVCYTGQRQSWIKHRFVQSIQKQYYKHHIAQEKDVQILLLLRYEVPFLVRALEFALFHNFAWAAEERHAPRVLGAWRRLSLSDALRRGCLLAGGERATVSSNSHAGKPSRGAPRTKGPSPPFGFGHQRAALAGGNN